MPIHALQKPSVALIGPGAVGTALALRLRQRRYEILGILGRTQASVDDLARRAHAPVASTRLADLPPDTRLLFCCVPDAAIEPVATTLADLPHTWPETTVAHTSGLLTAEALAPLREKGATTLSFHPLQSFAGRSSGAAFDGIFIAIEGDEQALATGQALARALGTRHLTLPTAAKATYHLAASMASNFLVTLMAMVQETLNAVGLDGATGTALMQPLVEQTWKHLLHTSPEQALTGPIVRGDQATVEAHGRELQAHLPHLVPAYTALAIETVRLAIRSGRLDPDVAATLLDRLNNLIQTPEQLPE